MKSSPKLRPNGWDALAAAAVLTLGNTAPLYYLPVLLGVSLFTGALTGLIAACLFRALAHTRLWGV